ncbi:MAG: hypothetical protein NVS1B1_10880 [Candidatus Limnocylindrales bacterium]
MTKTQRLAVPFLAAALLLSGSAAAVAFDPLSPIAADCDAKADANGDVDCEQTGEQGAMNEKGDKGETETDQNGEQGDKQTGDKDDKETGQNGDQGKSVTAAAAGQDQQGDNK